MAIITISREFGSGGRTLGRIIAKKLGYRFLDDIIIHEISKKAKVSKKWVKSLEDDAGGKLPRLFSGLVNKDYLERICEDKGYIDEKIYGKLLKEVVLNFAEEGNVVLMGRGGQFILKDFKDTCHILLIAANEDKVKFMQKHYQLSSSKAEKAITLGEKKRVNFYKKFRRRGYDNATHYDLVINTSRVTIEKARDLVCLLIQK